MDDVKTMMFVYEILIKLFLAFSGKTKDELLYNIFMSDIGPYSRKRNNFSPPLFQE